MEVTDKAELIEVTCPACGTKTERERLRLALFLFGCAECKSVWKHPLLQEREAKELKQN